MIKLAVGLSLILNRIFPRVSTIVSARIFNAPGFLLKLRQCARAWLLMIFLVFSAAGSQSAHAALSNEQMSAVLSVVTSYLLSDREPPIMEPEGRRLDINMGQVLAETYSTSSSIYAAFDLQEEAVEFCFDITSDVALQAGDISVLINGRPAQAAGEGKDNCHYLSWGSQREINYIQVLVNAPGVNVSLNRVELAAANQEQLTLPRLSRGEWDSKAVRKVLKVFAFGGHATDAQIQEWADMYPQDAIQEMLNFAEHNLKLSPLFPAERYTETAYSHGTLTAFYEYIESESSDIPIPLNDRQYLGRDGYRFASTFGRFVTMRGLNPFRQKIGFWETNYHLAVNRDAGVSRQQVVFYYDLIMEAHEAGLPYHEVLGVAAKSSAVASQYGHNRNRWVFDYETGEFICQCNDDYAREIHQLLYGIFGADDPNHEDGTIRETAKMLTDMPTPYIEGFGFALEVDFGTDRHHTADLTILGQTVSGANASEKIDNLMPISIQHPESLKNLPVMIIEVLADDNLSESRKNQLRAAWAAMGANKMFLDFIHAYAVSKVFHSRQQLKYATSYDRAYYTANKFNLDNIEAFFANDYFNGRAGRELDRVFEGDNASEVFTPVHNVFGHQTSIEASDSAVAFEKNFNRVATPEGWQYDHEFPARCSECDQGSEWKKDWAKAIPQPNSGYTAEYVGEWLWRHAVGSLDNYTELERAYLLAILGANREVSVHDYHLNDEHVFYDLNYLLCMRNDRVVTDGLNNNSLSDLMSYESWTDYCRNGDDGFEDFSPTEVAAFAQVFTGDDIANSSVDPFPYLRSLIDQLADAPVDIDSGDEIQRLRANQRVQAALAFIFATPFIFAEGE